MSEAAYGVRIHPAAEKELDKVNPIAAEQLTDRIKAASLQPEPTAHPKIKHIKGHDGYFRVRATGYRAICTLDKPDLKILLVGKRRTVYDRLDVAVQRARDGGGG